MRAVAEFTVHLDDQSIYELLNAADSPVAVLLEQISERAADYARAAVPIRKTRLRRSLKSTSFPPGYTLESIRTNVHWYQGLIYGGIAAEELPTIFLEYPAVQMSRAWHFMTEAFESGALDF